MAEIRTSSGKSLPGFPVRSESHPDLPSGQSAVSGSTGHRVGMGRDGKAFNSSRLAAERESSDQFHQDAEWCREHLPDEALCHAVSAYVICRRVVGRVPTADEVRGRLLATGRDRASVNALAKKYGTELLP